MSDATKAKIYRMVTPDHVCPFGQRAKELLQQHGFDVEEHVLGTREEVDAFEAELGVTTTPQIYIGGELVGGSEDLEVWLARESGPPAR